MVSLVLILASGALLVAGIMRGDDSLVIGSMVVSLLAAVALFAGIRRQRQALARRMATAHEPTMAEPLHADRAYAGEVFAEPAFDEHTPQVIEHGEQPTAVQHAAVGASVGAMVMGGAERAADSRELSAGAEQQPVIGDDGPIEDPPDEPPAELLMASEVSRIAELDTEVLVVDGRPRYHLPGCAHLTGRSAQGLPAAEAVELGFTACGMCGAATTLLAQAARS